MPGNIEEKPGQKPLEYRQPDLRADPPIPPRSFKYGPTRDGDDLPVTAVKWLGVIALIVWMVAEFLRDRK